MATLSSAAFSTTTQPKRSHRQAREEGNALIADWQASGLSLSAFAHQHNLPTHRLRYWLKQLGSNLCSNGVPPVLPSTFVELRPIAPSAGLDIVLPNGLCVHVGDVVPPELLRVVMNELLARTSRS